MKVEGFGFRDAGFRDVGVWGCRGFGGSGV